MSRTPTQAHKQEKASLDLSVAAEILVNFPAISAPAPGLSPPVNYRSALQGAGLLPSSFFPVLAFSLLCFPWRADSLLSERPVEPTVSS